MNTHAAIDTAGANETRPRGHRRLRLVLLVIVPVAVVAIALAFYLLSGGSESTDDAYARAGKLTVSAEVDGRVVAIAVQDEQAVRTGQLLFRLDPEPYAVAVAQAEAALASAKVDLASLDADARGSVAVASAAREQLAFATREAARQKPLLAEGISSQRQYDEAQLAVQDATQKLVSAQENTRSIRTRIGDAARIANNPRILAAQATLDEARRNLRNTTVRAPRPGIVSRVSQLQIGQYVERGRPLFAVVGQHNWVEANFKESQLAHMRVGQKARIRFDAFDETLDGHVAGFSPGTGSSFSLLPPENATGNWVKVVQRLPVRIEIDTPAPADHPIRAGLSATVTVDVSHH